jgi:hypothetical protein
VIDEAWASSLFEEKSLWDTYRVSRKFPTTDFNKKIRKWGYPALFIIAITYCWNYLDAPSTSRGIDAASSILVSISATILGFLIAGLAIFTTLSDKKILIALAKTPQKGTPVTAFKYLYFNLLNIFVIYIKILILSAVTQVMCKISPHADPIVVSGVIFPTANLVNGAVLSFLGIAFAEGITCLKAFIWNIYATFISVLTVSAFLEEAEKAP